MWEAVMMSQWDQLRWKGDVLNLFDLPSSRQGGYMEQGNFRMFLKINTAGYQGF